MRSGKSARRRPACGGDAEDEGAAVSIND